MFDQPTVRVLPGAFTLCHIPEFKGKTLKESADLLAAQAGVDRVDYNPRKGTVTVVHGEGTGPSPLMAVLREAQGVHSLGGLVQWEFPRVRLSVEATRESRSTMAGSIGKKVVGAVASELAGPIGGLAVGAVLDFQGAPWHVTPTRMRIQVPELQNRPAEAERLKKVLGRFPGQTGPVDYRPATGSFILNARPFSLEPEKVVAAVQHEGYLQQVPKPTSALAEVGKAAGDQALDQVIGKSVSLLFEALD